MGTPFLIAAIAMATLSNDGQKPEAKSLTGKRLSSPILSDERRKKFEGDYRDALRAYETDPSNVDAAVWVGRRLAYLGEFQASIAFYSAALKSLGESAKLLRHRGHRFITVRKFDAAIKDFEEAAKLIEGTRDEIEPDGIPNAKNQPISSLHSNIWYHLALARYLKGDYSKALSACDEGMKVSNNPDRLVSQTYWRYLILRKLGRDADAKAVLKPISSSTVLLENQAYLNLLLVFKGELDPVDVLAKAVAGNDAPTTAFGLGAWYQANGNKQRAAELFDEAVSSPNWPAFGFIAAEVELHRSARSDWPPSRIY